jgi:hypothetical protein
MVCGPNGPEYDYNKDTNRMTAYSSNAERTES